MYRNQQWSGSVYLGGRAVEALLRSLLWSLDLRHVGHDLKELYRVLRRGGSSPPVADSAAIVNAINEVSIVWRNNFRFVDDECFRRMLKQSGRWVWIGKLKITGDPLKLNAKHCLEACERIVAVLEPACKRRLSTR